MKSFSIVCGFLTFIFVSQFLSQLYSQTSHAQSNGVCDSFGIALDQAIKTKGGERQCLLLFDMIMAYEKKSNGRANNSWISQCDIDTNNAQFAISTCESEFEKIKKFRRQLKRL